MTAGVATRGASTGPDSLGRPSWRNQNLLSFTQIMLHLGHMLDVQYLLYLNVKLVSYMLMYVNCDGPKGLCSVTRSFVLI